MVLVAPGGFIRKSCRSLTSGISQVTSSPPPYSAKLDNHPQQQHRQYHQLTSMYPSLAVAIIVVAQCPAR